MTVISETRTRSEFSMHVDAHVQGAAEVKLEKLHAGSPLAAHPRRCQFYEAPADRRCRDTQGLFLEKTLLARWLSLKYFGLKNAWPVEGLKMCCSCIVNEAP